MNLLGNLYIFEGADCVGKSSLAKLFAQHTNSHYYAFPGREPGTLGHHIYEVHHGLHGKFDIVPESLQMLHVAAHLTVLHTRIFPWLDNDEAVVLDRCYWSTYAYGLTYGVPEQFLRRLVQLERDYWSHYLDNAQLFWVTRDGPLSKPFDELDDKKALSRSNWDTINCTYAKLFERNDWDDLPRLQVVNDSTIDEALLQIRRFW